MSAVSAVRSMTGYAAVEGSFADGAAFTLAAKSVNHRFLDVQLRLPSGCDALEMELRRLVKERVERGHVEVALDLGRSDLQGSREMKIDEALLDGLVASLRTASVRLGLSEEPRLSDLLRVSGVLNADVRAARPSMEEMMVVVPVAAESALERMNAAREREGAALEAELRAGMERLRAASEAVSGLRAGVRQAQFTRLRTRLEELLASASISEDRLLTEAALLAEKSDVEEEAVRLRTHVERFLGILEEGGTVGKRLDFLLQELNREANTTLAKTGAAAGSESVRITELGLVMKVEIERAREQVQNLE